MQTVDIEAIIKKYSSPYWIGNSKTDQGVKSDNTNEGHKNNSYLESYQNWGQNEVHHRSKYEDSQDVMNNNSLNQPSYWQKFTNYEQLSTNPHNNLDQIHNYRDHKPIEHIYEPNNQHSFDSWAGKSTMSQNEEKKESELWKLINYKAHTPYDPLDYQSIKPSIIDHQNNKQVDILHHNILNQQVKSSLNDTVLQQSDLMNVFSNQKVVHLNLLNQSKLYLNELQESKPQIAVNSSLNNLRRTQQNSQKQSISQYQNQFPIKPNSKWLHSSQRTNFNNSPNLQIDQVEDYSIKTNKKSNNIKEIDRMYKKVESTTTNYTPNNEGFIPLHKNKEQLENNLYDLNDYESRDKRVYNRIEIKGTIKTSKLADFENSSFCGWKNKVVYDISTKDDNKNKLILGKWC